MNETITALDGQHIITLLSTMIILALFIERSLSLLFESRMFINRFQGKSIKELIAFIICSAVSWNWKFDAISLLLQQGSPSLYGSVVTGAILAGGAKASIKLFHDVLNVKSQAQHAKTTMALIKDKPLDEVIKL